MLATFCLRLACGMTGALLLVVGSPLNPRFFRAHFLIVLGLTVAATLALRTTAGEWLWLTLIAAMVLASLGSVAWSLEGAPGGLVLVILTALALVGSVVPPAFPAPVSVAPGLDGPEEPGGLGTAGWVVDQLASSALLGVTMTAMLVGHSYLISPTLSLAPLMRMLHAVFAFTLVRGVVAGLALWDWTRVHSLLTLNDVTVLLLPLRWGLGFAGMLALTWMAREAAKIRATQSATGILYVVVIFCFLGELTALLLLRITGHVL